MVFEEVVRLSKRGVPTTCRSPLGPNPPVSNFTHPTLSLCSISHISGGNILVGCSQHRYWRQSCSLLPSCHSIHRVGMFDLIGVMIFWRI
ncbi:uncharacterized protein LACBIDRAFT_315526 [Laccaria bicolor S238N-H82]|uniref:Predicted protein n=1 Tax=Laccaria bicolor (strain S238N-H82 / ATCC MYA-4686) TaxID=486041 RepID=B0D2K9_LACBS|nr:uncharacterized protein LACBIDRAFT_315526 [Laccaria bicolor S238N-H82]EDR10769.1 predicted protein [Laccaria bicolor S238N-H82]|eukprot:XP_001878070.1 predicted protein [Laccaria bicolor S238N-H82]